MPPKYVKTIEDEIYFEYAKFISRSSLNKLDFAFVTNRFKALRDGKISISEQIREWQAEQKLPKNCVFCGSDEQLQTDHLIPKSRGGSDSPDNLVLACKHCNISRSNNGIFYWLGLDKKDDMHRLLAGKYLKQLYKLHENHNTLKYTINEIIENLCPNCNNQQACKRWDKTNKLTVFCLESIF